MVEMADEDRISEMPDDVLVHILSFCRYKDGVRAAAVSRRWQRLYMQLPVVYFPFENKTSDDMEKMKRLLHQRSQDENHSVHHLFLIGRKDLSEQFSYTEKFIALANAQILEISLEFSNRSHEEDNGAWSLELPPKTTKLMLYLCSFAIRPPHIHGLGVNSLKSFTLDGLTVLQQDSLLSSFPSLEDLHIKDCTLASGIDITSQAMPRLKHLRMTDISVVDGNSTSIVNIHVKELETLRMSNCRDADPRDPSSPVGSLMRSHVRCSFTIYSSFCLCAPKLREFNWLSCYAKDVHIKSVGRLSHVELALTSGRLPKTWDEEIKFLQMEDIKKLMRSIIAGLIRGLQPLTLDHVERNCIRREGRSLTCHIIGA